jgi:hypothetical protein
MADDPWLAPLRKKPAFTKALRHAEAQHADASAAFASLGGETALAL